MKSVISFLVLAFIFMNIQHCKKNSLPKANGSTHHQDDDYNNSSDQDSHSITATTTNENQDADDSNLIHKSDLDILYDDTINTSSLSDDTQSTNDDFDDSGHDDSPMQNDELMLNSLPALYVALDGDDTHDGSETNPVKTFQKAVSLLQPGYVLRIASGTYHESLKIEKDGNEQNPIYIRPASVNDTVIIDIQNNSKSNISLLGDYLNISMIETKNSGNFCIDIGGNHILVSKMKVHHCESHAVHLWGTYIQVSESEIYDSVLENEKEQGAWGSALKVKVGGENIHLFQNKVYHNWGEGIAATRGKHIIIEQNYVYDNYSNNIYVDNSIDVKVLQNFSVCHDNSPVKRDGKLAHGIAIGEEKYDGWGAQLSDIIIANNITAFCEKGIATYEPEVNGGGLKNVTIVYNTLWGSKSTALSIYKPGTTKTQNVIVANNLTYQKDGKTAYISSRQGIDMYNNFWVDEMPSDWTNAQGTDDTSGDAKLAMTPTYKTDSFRLSSNSSAIGSAKTIAGLDMDFEGNNRFPANDTLSDIGAIEFQINPPQSDFDSFFQL